MTISQWSTTPANNASGVTNVNWAEGQAPSTVNDSARNMMADVAAWYQASYATFQARLTLTSGTPVTTSDVTAAGTLYLTPYKGNQIWLYDGSAQWNLFNLTEISLALTLTSGKPYDIFVYNNAGTPALESLVWTNDTTRATALALQNGIYVKSGTTTRRYVGTIYASGANTTEDSLAKRFVWNYYNRVERGLQAALEATASWTYSTATIRQANANAANQLDFVRGLDEDQVIANVIATVKGSLGGDALLTSIGLDSTTATAAKTLLTSPYPSLANVQVTGQAFWRGLPGVGRHTLTWLEKGHGAGTDTWYGSQDVNAQAIQSGISGSMLA